MKAFLLAAGFGTRLRPLTDRIPKCLVPVEGVPMLEWWMELLRKHGVTEVLINTHYLYEQVREYIEEYNRRDCGLKIVEAYEPELVGSAGTIRDNFDFVRGEREFLICYADNLTNVDLSSMIEFHRSKNALLTMGLFRTNVPKQCGIAAVDVDGRIYEFVEKPENPKSNLANAGIYVAGSQIEQYFPKEGFADFAKDVLMKLENQMYGWEIKQYLIDIGTPENYKKAQEEWKLHDHH